MTDGKYILNSFPFGTIWLREADSFEQNQIFEGHSETVSSVDFSVDGRFFAPGSYDNTVRLWDMDSRSLLHTFKGHKNEVSGIALSPDGKTIASVSEDRFVFLWDLESRKRTMCALIDFAEIRPEKEQKTIL